MILVLFFSCETEVSLFFAVAVDFCGKLAVDLGHVSPQTWFVSESIS